jgi:hypothetical protein
LKKNKKPLEVAFFFNTNIIIFILIMEIKTYFFINEKQMISNKNKIEKLLTYSRKVRKYGLIGIFMAFSMHSNVYAQHLQTDTNEQKICKEKLEKINLDDNNFKHLNQIYKNNLHFKLGHGHIMIPGWYADYDDIVKAKQEIFEKDIPYIVYDLARSEDLNSKQIVSLGVLSQFGLKALPCINAALDQKDLDKNCVGCYRLTSSKISIEVNEEVK